MFLTPDIVMKIITVKTRIIQGFVIKRSIPLELTQKVQKIAENEKMIRS